MSRSSFWLWLRVFVAATGVTVALACVTRPVDEPDPVDTTTEPAFFPQSIEKDVDILFIIDNSGSMGEEQENLLQNFPKLIDALRSETLGDDPNSDLPCTETDVSGCNIPNVHIGVVSTDLGAGNYSLDRCSPGGDRGVLQNAPKIAGCTPPSKRFISYIDGRTNIPDGDSIEQVKQAFSCIAKLGTGGCGFEHSLEAARRALDVNATPENAEFIRDNAFLAVVFITDEDDCSAAKPQLFDPGQSKLTDPLGPLNSFRCFEFGIECDVNDRNKIGPRQNCRPAGDWLHTIPGYVDFYKALKPQGRIIVAAIAGPTNRVEVGRQDNEPTLLESCRSGLGLAAPAIRVKAIIDAFAPDSQFTSICDADFGPAMQALGQKILGKLGAQCIGSPLLTEAGGLACQQGDTFGGGQTCAANCLEKAACDVVERVGTEGGAQTIAKCPTELWYPANWETDRDCATLGVCPCWRIVKKRPDAPAGKRCDPNADGTPYALDILREGEAPKGTVAEASCLTASVSWTSGTLAEIEQCL